MSDTIEIVRARTLYTMRGRRWFLPAFTVSEPFDKNDTSLEWVGFTHGDQSPVEFSPEHIQGDPDTFSVFPASDGDAVDTGE